MRSKLERRLATARPRTDHFKPPGLIFWLIVFSYEGEG
jgi:hypothetical protein